MISVGIILLAANSYVIICYPDRHYLNLIIFLVAFLHRLNVTLNRSRKHIMKGQVEMGIYLESLHHGIMWCKIHPMIAVMVATVDCFFSIKIIESMRYNWGYGSREEIHTWKCVASNELKDFLKDQSWVAFGSLIKASLVFYLIYNYNIRQTEFTFGKNLHDVLDIVILSFLIIMRMVVFNCEQECCEISLTRMKGPNISKRFYSKMKQAQISQIDFDQIF
ncbi:hypothetical protein TrispH2_009571 [Trichoplax sp. H2]|nr:hypothetical protein TrispH2_009571 [Trichoplax sp. H2]|eukprot:RDD38041.1 hypothetical protein TrispH2_009571 [Trichoplax sp. H2]